MKTETPVIKLMMSKTLKAHSGLGKVEEKDGNGDGVEAERPQKIPSKCEESCWGKNNSFTG